MCENLRRLMLIEAKARNGVHYSEYVEQDMPGDGPPPPRVKPINPAGPLPRPMKRTSPRALRAAMRPKRRMKPSDNSPRSGAR